MYDGLNMLDFNLSLFSVSQPHYTWTIAQGHTAQWASPAVVGRVFCCSFAHPVNCNATKISAQGKQIKIYIYMSN